MPDRNEKAQRERKVFEKFAERSDPSIVRNSIQSRDSPEPDILCEISGVGPVAFELKEICDPTFAESLNYLKKRDNPEGKVLRLDSSAPLRESLEHVRGKNYTSNYRIELLFYTDERYGSPRYGLPPDVIIPNIERVFTAESHCFKRVWFMGEPDGTCECVVEAQDVI